MLPKPLPMAHIQGRLANLPLDGQGRVRLPTLAPHGGSHKVDRCTQRVQGRAINLGIACPRTLTDPMLHDPMRPGPHLDPVLQGGQAGADGAAALPRPGSVHGRGGGGGAL